MCVCRAWFPNIASATLLPFSLLWLSFAVRSSRKRTFSVDFSRISEWFSYFQFQFDHKWECLGVMNGVNYFPIDILLHHLLCNHYIILIMLLLSDSLCATHSCVAWLQPSPDCVHRIFQQKLQISAARHNLFTQSALWLCMRYEQIRVHFE